MMKKDEFSGMLLGEEVRIRVADGRVFVRDGEYSRRIKKVAGRGGPDRVLDGVWCNDEDCMAIGFQWEMFTGLAERVQILVWCRRFLKDGTVVESDGFYQRV